MTFQQYPFKGGIPSGNTAARPGSPVIGDTYYNGQLEILEIWNGTTWVAVSAPPSTPQIVSVTDVSTSDAYTATGGKLAVVFQAGSGGGTPSQYNAFTTAGGFSASSSSTSVTITGLTPGTAYTVYGNGQNNFGTTVNTPNAAAVTPSTLPQVPTIGTTTLTNGLPVVNWTLGNNGGKGLTSITITPYLNGTTAQTSRTAATTSSTSYSFTAGQLTEDASYTFKVKVTNPNGDSPESSASNSVTVNAEFSGVDALVIAGGGSGASPGGGGGAGGYRTVTNKTVTKGTNYTVTVGGGAGSATSTYGNKGSNSTFDNITSTGGGRGRNGTSTTGPGGSGGGGSRDGAQTGGAGNEGGFTPSEGNNGGTSVVGPYIGGGGGGGASQAGTGGTGGSSTTETGGKGGDGTASSITGTSVTRAGGGGGGAENLPSGGAGAGGAGGGGAGSAANSAATAGTANTGGGGGGTGQAGQTSGPGGSGVVIISFPTASGTITIGAGLTGTTTTNGSNTVATITAGTGNVSWS